MSQNAPENQFKISAALLYGASTGTVCKYSVSFNTASSAICMYVNFGTFYLCVNHRKYTSFTAMYE